MKKIYLIVAVLLAVFLGSTTMKAQMPSPDCPDGSWTKPTNCLYTQMTFPNNVVCSLYICYCYKIVNQIPYYYITACSFGTACANGIEDMSTVLDAAAKQLLKWNPNGDECPPCPRLTYNAEVQYHVCYHIVNDTINLISRIEPCNGIGSCIKHYKVCCIENTGEKVITLDSTFPSVGSTCTGGSDCWLSCP